MKKKPFDPFKDKMPLMPLWGLYGKMQDNSNPTEAEKREALAEIVGDRKAAGIRTTKKDKKRLGKDL